MGEISDKLRGLYRAVDALGGWGRSSSEYDAGHERGIEQALDVLEAAGFSEGKSTAADVIDAAPDAAFMEEVREVLEALVRNVQEWVDDIEAGGTGWDDWDRHYKYFAYHGGLARASALLAKMEGK